GVQLARFNPIDLPVQREQAPAYAAGRDERERPATKRLLDELTDGDGDGSVQVIGTPTWRSAPAVYREHALFLAASEEQAREQQACGARVIGPVAVLAGGGAGRELDAAALARPHSMGHIKAEALQPVGAH